MALTGLQTTANEPPTLGLKALLKRVEAIRVRDGVPSVALTLVNRQRILWTGALGVSDIESGEPATADTLYRIGSITKAFTSLAVLIASEDGSLRLDDRLGAIAPGAPLTNPWAETRPVRIAHLLEHSAGLLDITEAEFDSNNPAPLSLREALEVAPKARRSHWPPGLHFSYSNAGAGLAAYALERATGQRYEDFLGERLLEPLGMDAASFFLNAATAARLATGYDSDGHTVIPYWHIIFRPSGGMNANAREMGAFVRLLLNSGRLSDGRRLLSENAVNRMEQPRTTLAAHHGLTYGYGLSNYAFIHNGFVFHGHGGDADGYLSHYAYSRRLGLGYFVTINAFKDASLRAIRDHIQDFLTAGKKAPAPARNTRPDRSEFQRLTGRYRAVTWRFPWTSSDSHERDELEVFVRDGRLYTRDEGEEPTALVPVTARLYRRPDEPIATIAFVRHAGMLYVQGDFGNYRRLEGGDTGAGSTTAR